jgi:hypothetical protein
MRNQNIFFSDISEIGLAKQPVSHTPTKLSRGAKVDEIRDIKDIAKAVREYVKKKYPNCKFSVNIERFAGGQSMTVSLQEADFNPLTNDAFWDKGSGVNKYFSVNKYQFEKSDKLTDEAIAVLKDVRDFYMQYNYDYSEPQSDYFNVRFYEDITIGKWDKGFIQVAKKSKTSRTPKPTPKKSDLQPKFAIGSSVFYKTSKGSEAGKILKSAFITSQNTYLYGIENPRGGIYNIWESNIISGEDTPEPPTPETPTPDPEIKFTFKVGDVFRRNTEDDKPPNTKITYTILSIGEEKTQYRIDYLDKGTNRLSTKSNEKITEEITNDWWIPYEFIQVENNSLQEAISQLRDENDAMSEMYLNSEDPSLRKELRESSNENNTAINDFSADLFFEPQKFMNQYFNRATEKFSYDNSELSNEEFAKIIESDEFINWFGDFRKPISEKNLVSKVVGLDDTRQPLVVYHGTWNKTHFSRFKFKKFPVIYFATNKSYAEWFAKLGTGIMYQCFLDIKYLCDFRPLGASSVTWSELSLFLNKQYGFFLPQKETKNAKLPVWAWIRKDAPNFDLINTIKEQGFTGMAQIEDNPQDILPNGEKNITTAYMIFSPEQAKLVRYVSTGNAFTNIFYMKKGGKVQNALLERIKNLKL